MADVDTLVIQGTPYTLRDSQARLLIEGSKLSKGIYGGDINKVDGGVSGLATYGMYWVGPGLGTTNLPKAEYGEMLVLSNAGHVTEIILFIDGDIYTRMYFNGGGGAKWHSWTYVKGAIAKKALMSTPNTEPEAIK